MFGRRITLFRIFGFEVRADLSWIIIVVLVAFTFAQFLRQSHPDATSATLWTVALFGALLFFASIVAHELSHSLAARTQGIQMKGITLFIFGGVAEMEDEPPNARAEFIMAIVGPMMSIALGILFTAVALIGGTTDLLPPLISCLGYLAMLNFALAVFNLVPAFPLDGGRVLRALLWNLWGDLRRATRAASFAGTAFGTVLVVAGIFFVLSGNWTGFWWILIGLFLRGAASAPYQQLLARQALEGERVRRFMREDPITVPRSIPVSELVNDYVYRHHFKMFPVVDGERLLGCVSVESVRDVPREDWDAHSVQELMEPCTEENTIGPDEDAVHALSKLTKSGRSRLMVVQDERLVGILSLRDLLSFLALKVELEKA